MKPQSNQLPLCPMITTIVCEDGSSWYLDHGNISAICNKCSEELISRHRHDYAVCKCKAGGASVDGGLAYLKRRGSYKDTSLTDQNTFEEIREGFEWGSYGKDGKGKLRYVKLKDMEIGHINAILKTQNLQEHIRVLFLEEFFERNK